ncbi:hypothetical protein [Duganella vulcania]|uniref:hypothetical protein n=1 Tax=Duganella vulcania TaxID=2692166 RepID=UPI0020C43D48|nr:hypothetical protein [Duganella vulcania]
MSQPTRFPWDDFPNVLIHASESLVKCHRAYAPAKSGDVSAAAELVFDTLSLAVLAPMVTHACKGKQFSVA